MKVTVGFFRWLVNKSFSEVLVKFSGRITFLLGFWFFESLISSF